MLRVVQAIIAIFLLILLLKVTVVAIKFLLFIGIAAFIYNIIKKW